LFVRALEAYSRRRYGGALDPGLVALHNRRVLLTLMEIETSAARWNCLDHTVKALATMAAAATIGGEWCLDHGCWESHNRGLTGQGFTDRCEPRGQDRVHER